MSSDRAIDAGAEGSDGILGLACELVVGVIVDVSVLIGHSQLLAQEAIRRLG